MEHAATAAAMFLVGLLIGMTILRVLIRIKRSGPIKTMRDRLEELKLAASPKVLPTLDKTKRKSLQPGSQRAQPKGYIDPNTHQANSPVVRPPSPEERAQKTRSAIPAVILTDAQADELKGHFSHRFFGSQLIVGDRTVLGGLSRAHHRIEITKEDRVFVDNVPFDLAPGDAHAIKFELIKARL